MNPTEKITIWALIIGIGAGVAFYHYTDNSPWVCALFGLFAYAVVWHKLIGTAAKTTVVDAKVLQQKAADR